MLVIQKLTKTECDQLMAVVALNGLLLFCSCFDILVFHWLKQSGSQCYKYFVYLFLCGLHKACNDNNKNAYSGQTKALWSKNQMYNRGMLQQSVHLKYISVVPWFFFRSQSAFPGNLLQILHLFHILTPSDLAGKLTWDALIKYMFRANVSVRVCGLSSVGG